MANVIRPPQRLTKAQRVRRSLYLAGSFVDGGWRDEVIAALADLDVDVYDPRDGVWETDAAADLSAGSFAGKLSWQMGNATDADVVAFWLPPGARAETAMLQLGALAAKRGGARRGSSVIVGLPDGHAADVVRRFAAASAVQHVPALADVVRVARYELTRTDG